MSTSFCPRCCRRRPQERFENVPAAERLAVRVWNDIFVEDQNSTDGKPEGYFFTAFKDAVAQIGPRCSCWRRGTTRSR